MSCSVTLTQLRRKQKADGTIPIYVRFTQKGISKYLSTGISVKPEHWNKKRREVRKSNPMHKIYNHELSNLLLDIEQEKLSLKSKKQFNLKSLKESFSQSDSGSVLAKAKAYHEKLENLGRYWEWKRFGVVINNLEDFLSGRSISVDSIDTEFIEDFQQYLLGNHQSNQEKKFPGNSANTVRRKLRSLKGFIKDLIKRKEIGHNPFTFVEIVRATRSEKTKLTTEQIQRIIDLNLEEGSKLWHSRNYFLYSYYNAGIRFGDLCTLRWGNIIDGRLVYIMGKTQHPKSIKQIDQMERILSLYRRENAKESDYIFPILKEREFDNENELKRAIGSCNTMINIKLKKIAQLAGIEANVSTHVSKHSFAQLALNNQLGIYELSKALGHKDLKSTQHYIKSFDEVMLDSGMQKVFKKSKL